MPGAYMPTDAAGEIADLQDRCRRLESFQNSTLRGTAVPVGGSMVPITAGQNLGFCSAAPFSAAWTNVPNASAQFTVSAAQNVFVMSGVAWVGNGGTANYIFVRLAVMATGLTGAVVDTSPIYVATNGGGYANASPFIVAPFTPATWYVSLQYKMDVGATTTITTAAGSLAVQISAFGLG